MVNILYLKKGYSFLTLTLYHGHIFLTVLYSVCFLI